LQNKNDSLLRPTLIFGLVLSALIWSLYFHTLEIPINIGGTSIEFRLNQLLIPITSAATLLYVSQIVEKLIDGILQKPLIKSLRVNSVFLPLYIVSYWPQNPEYLVSLLTLPFLISVLLTILGILKLYLQNYSGFMYPILRGIQIFTVGLLITRVYSITLTEVRSAIIAGELNPELEQILFDPILDSLGQILWISMILTTIASLIGATKVSKDPYISFIGSKIGEKLHLKFLIFITISSYFIILRSILQIMAGDISSLIGIAEWSLVCVFFYTGYKSAKKYADEFLDQNERINKWTKHTQHIKYTTDQKLENLSKLVQNFVEKGDKTLLSITLTSLMTSYGYNPDQVYRVLHGFIEYKDLEPGPLALNSQIKYLQNKNMLTRSGIIAKTLEDLDAKGLIKREDTPYRVDEYEVVKNEN